MFNYSRWRKYMKSLTPVERELWWLDKAACVFAFLITAVFVIALCMVFRGCVKLAVKSNAAGRERVHNHYLYTVEHWEQRTPDYIIPFNFEGHKYLERSGGGICHAESCPCRTNKTEIAADGK